MSNDTDLRKRLTPEQYRITQRAGTEAPFTGPHLDEKRPGIYQCICCGASLFDSDAKYDSGSGWPSYTKPADPAAVSRHTDHKLLMTRTEIRCTKCDAHLGHVFADGPAPTGERYCINGHVLHFKAANDDTD